MPRTKQPLSQENGMATSQGGTKRKKRDKSDKAGAGAGAEPSRRLREARFERRVERAGS